jgi:predicted small secreted protein
MTRKLVMAALGLALAAPLALTGCNTVAGMGEDVSATGRAVTNAATYSAPANEYYYHRETVRRY